MKKTAEKIIEFIEREWSHNLYCEAARMELQKFLDEGEEEPLTNHAGDCTIYSAMMNGWPYDGICTCGYGWQQHREGKDNAMCSEERLMNTLGEPPQSFTSGTNDMIECKGVDPEVAHTLPPFEEWWGGLKKPVINDPHFHRQLCSIEVARRDAQAIYNSLASQLKPISDEEAVRRFNELIHKRDIESFINQRWHAIRLDLDTAYRLKPPAKEDWEGACEKYWAWMESKGENIDDSAGWDSFKSVYEFMTEAGQKEKGTE